MSEISGALILGCHMRSRFYFIHYTVYFNDHFKCVVINLDFFGL